MRKGIARTTLGRLREDYAATKLQCAIRKHTQIKKYRQFRHAAIVLQKGNFLCLCLFLFCLRFVAVLAFYAARKFAAMKLDSAVTTLQTAIRKAAVMKWRRRLVFGVVKAQAR
jgi:hypothetical protein